VVTNLVLTALSPFNTAMMSEGKMKLTNFPAKIQVGGGAQG